MARVPDQGDGIGDWLFGPSDESKARVADIRERWGRLQTWGVREKLPNTRSQQHAVQEFLSSWDRSPDVTAISAASADVMAMELYAEDYDKARGGTFRASLIGTPFDIEGSSRFMRTAAVADKAAREVSAVVKEAGHELKEAAQPLLQEVGAQLPTLMGLGIAVALFGVAIAVKALPKVTYG
ncbi:hypothetical protein BE11_41975 [Sorangium cellulosum]|nr:hypothetical protein BE11_41975 [Sorangium cellulosum]